MVIVKYKINLKLIIILDLYIQILQIKKFCLLELKSSITLKIKGKGYNHIFGYENDQKFNRSYYPNEVYINGQKQDSVNYSYYFQNDSNSVELIWNNSIKSCRQMFRNCSQITEVDLSNFNSSEILDINSLFFNCFSLTSVNFSILILQK